MSKAQSTFEQKSLTERVSVIQRIIQEIINSSDELKSQMAIELGRSKFAVEEEWRLCESFFEQFPNFCNEVLAEKEEKEGAKWQYAPVGSVLIGTNSALPIYTILSNALPALAAGNAVTVRPSLHCPLSASVIASSVHKAEVPHGLFQLIYGNFDVFRKVALTHQFSTVFYAGMEEMGEQLRHDLWSNSDTKLVLSGAGKNAAIVCESANIDNAVSQIVLGTCVDCGQRMEATTLAFIHKSLFSEFSEKIVHAIKTLPISAKEDLSDSETHFMGPLCSQKAHERFLRFQGIAARESEETLRWGKPIDNKGEGYFVSPGVHVLRLENLEKSVYAKNAFFGPDVALVSFDNIAEVAVVLNKMNAARVLSIFTNFDEQVRTIRNMVHVPTVAWNTTTTNIDSELPTLGRGHAGNTLETGMRFIYSCVYPRVLNLKERASHQITLFSKSFLWLLAFFSIAFAPQAKASYERAVEGSDVVKEKLYPRSGRFQLLGPQGGMILNTSFVDTFLISGGITYHINEWHGLNIGVFYGINKDRDERSCLENFFSNPQRARDADTQNILAGQQCDPNNLTDPTIDKDAEGKGPYHRKPAYMAIRQIDLMVDINYQWTPVYGKALWFLSGVSYLDIFTSVGVGMANSTYFPVKTITNSGKDIKTEGTDDLNETGVNGRPQEIKQSSPLFSVGIGSRLFFLKHFLADVEFRNFTVVGTDGTDSMNFFALCGGIGFIF